MKVELLTCFCELSGGDCEVVGKALGPTATGLVTYFPYDASRCPVVRFEPKSL